MKKKLLIGTDSFLPRWDGISRFLNEILPALAHDYDVTVIAPDFKGTAQAPHGIKIIRIPLWGMTLGDYKPPKLNFAVIKKAVSEADIIFTQTIGPIGAMSVFEGRRQKKNVVAYIHSIEWELFTFSISPNRGFRSLLYNFTKIAARFIYNKCDLLLVPSREIADFISHEGIRTQKKVLHMGTDLNKFLPPKNKAEAKKLVGLDPDSIVIGFVGRLGKEKSLSTLYRAFLRIKKNHKVQLLIVGNGVPEIRNLFTGKEGIVYAGHQDDVVPYYQAMDISVLPSLTETSSLSTIEAMACGVPVVCTPVGYVRIYVKPGVNGFLFPRKNSFALAHHLKKLITDEKLRLELGNNARKLAITQFSWEKMVQELKQVLELY